MICNKVILISLVVLESSPPKIACTYGCPFHMYFLRSKNGRVGPARVDTSDRVAGRRLPMDGTQRSRYGDI